MAMGEFAAVIEGLATMLTITHKNEAPIDYALLTQLTRAILDWRDRDPAGMTPISAETVEEEAVELSPVVLEEIEEIGEIEEREKAKEDEEKEEKDAKEDEKEAEHRGNREFLVKQLSGLFDELQKRVGKRGGGEK